MAIKTMNTSLFDKITGTTSEEVNSENKEDVLSQEDISYLYEKGIEELRDFQTSLEILKAYMVDIFCGTTLIATEESSNFFCSMEMFANELIPAILQGDPKEIYKYCSEEMTEDELDAARTEFFQMLYKKYLER